MRCVSWLTRLCLALVAVPLAAAGCAHVPGAYTMSPKAVEYTRARLGTIGVVVAPYCAMLSFATRLGEGGPRATVTCLRESRGAG